MWYILKIDKVNVTYKILKASGKYDEVLKKYEEKEKQEPSFCMEAIMFDKNNYFSKNEQALERKVKELGPIYADELLSDIKSKEKQLNVLKKEILQKRIKRNHFLSDFEKSEAIDIKAFILENIEKIKITKKILPKAKKIYNLEYLSDDSFLYHLRETMQDEEMFYRSNVNFCINTENKKITINPNNFFVINVEYRK